MLAQTTDSVIDEISYAISHLPTINLGMDFGANLIFVFDINGYREFVSKFAEECFFKQRSVYSIKDCWIFAKQQVRSVLGVVFARIIIENVLKGMNVSVKSWDAFAGRYVSETLNNLRTIEYENDQLLQNGLSNELKQVFSTSPPMRYHGIISCGVCLNGSEKFKCLETFEKHLSIHADFFKRFNEINLALVEHNIKRFLNGSLIPLDCLDLTASDGVWLIPKNACSPAFDFIHIKNEEIWFFKATVSDFHENDDFTYIKKIGSILNPEATLSFFFLSPVDIKCSFSRSQKQTLTAEGMRWREMVVTGDLFDLITLND